MHGLAGDHEVLETIPARSLIASWRSDFKIDVARLFEGVDEVALVRERGTGRIRFEPPVTGDAAFYQALRRFVWYHPKVKQEHVAAAGWAKPGAFVLDVGAGDGAFAKHVPDARYVGLETDPEAVAAARARGLDLRQLDLAVWRESDAFAPADLAASFQVLEHVPDPDGFVAGLAACLAPGGRLALGTPDAASYVTRLPDFMLNAPPHHVSWWDEATLRALVEAAGLRVLDVRRFPVEPWERRLYWMAQIAQALRAGRTRPVFGQELYPAKAAGWIGSWPLQLWTPRNARGSTLLLIAERG